MQSLLRHKYVLRTWDLDIYDGLGIEEMEMEMTCRLLMTPRSIFGYADPPLSHFFAGDFVITYPFLEVFRARNFLVQQEKFHSIHSDVKGA